MADRCTIVSQVRRRSERISLVDATVASGVYAVRSPRDPEPRASADGGVHASHSLDSVDAKPVTTASAPSP